MVWFSSVSHLKFTSYLPLLHLCNKARMNSENQLALERGVFTISLDFELIWGTLDLFGPDKFRRDCEIERESVIDRLLALFAEFDVAATWCILGHLFLDGCVPVRGHKHPEIFPPRHSWLSGDWFAHDPCTGPDGDRIFYGRELVEKIKACPVPQEIGSHSFSHVIFGDSGCLRATAESEIRECVRLAAQQGLALHSFAFPRNEVGYLDVLRQHGFWCYRGPEPNWYENPSVPPLLRRILRLTAVLTAASPQWYCHSLLPKGCGICLDQPSTSQCMGCVGICPYLCERSEQSKD